MGGYTAKVWEGSRSIKNRELISLFSGENYFYSLTHYFQEVGQIGHTVTACSVRDA